MSKSLDSETIKMQYASGKRKSATKGKKHTSEARLKMKLAWAKKREEKI